MATRTLCPSCKYDLGGLPGAPALAHGPFTSDVVCPECGAAYPTGSCVLIGGSQPFAMIRDRPLIVRAMISLAYGHGCTTAILHAIGVWSLWYLSIVALNLLAGGRGYLDGVRGFGTLFALASLIAIVRFWWVRRRADAHAPARADEIDRWLVVGPGGVRNAAQDLKPSEVRTVRVYECLGAGQGRVAAAVIVYALTEQGLPTATTPIHIVLPRSGSRGDAATLAAQLMAAVRGRESPAPSIGDELTGRFDLPRFNLRWIALALIVLSLPLFSFLLLSGGILAVMLAFPVIGLLLTLVSHPKVGSSMRWRFRDDTLIAIRRVAVDSSAFAGPMSGRPAGEFEVSRVRRIDEFARLELRSSHGMPYLKLVTRAFWRRNLLMIPDDWLGMAPEVFAAMLAEKLGIPCRNNARDGA